MIEATQLKNGVTFKMDGNPYKVLKYFHQKIGRGGASVKLAVQNLKTGNTEEKTMNSNSKVDEIETNKRLLQYLYNDKTTVFFMDMETYEQIEIPANVLKNELLFIKEGSNVEVLYWDDKPLSVEIQPKVSLEVKMTNPGIKGNSATNVFKSATLENGLVLKVPLFINKGDRVRVDTRTGEYVERVKA